MDRIVKKIGIVFLAAILGVFSAGLAMAQHGGHGHGAPASASMGDMSHGGGHSMAMKDRFVQSASVDGYKITLDVMDMSMHMAMPGMKGNSMPDADHSKSHVLMVTVQDAASKEILSDAKIQYTLVSPSGKQESGKLEWSGDHFGAGFSPKEKGAYQVQLMVESGGMEREAKFSLKL